MPIFDLEKANRRLPLIEKIVGYMVEDYEELRKANRELTRLKVESLGSDRSTKRIVALEQSVYDLSHACSGYLKELEVLGVECRDFLLGLVDFPAIVDGRPAYYCWRRGEERVSFWHPADKGFADREPVRTGTR